MKRPSDAAKLDNKIKSFNELMRLSKAHALAHFTKSQLVDMLAHVVGQVEYLAAWLERLQNDSTTTCVYCGHDYGPNASVSVEGTTPDVVAALTAHVAACPKHPMLQLKSSAQALLDAIDMHIREPSRRGWPYPSGVAEAVSNLRTVLGGGLK